MTKVLIVEDDQVLVKMYKTKFTLSGFSVEVAMDGEEGVAKAQSFLPDIILMDIMMPKLDGLSAMQLIKSNAVTKDIPVVMLSNLSTPQDSDAAIKKGASAYIVKSSFTPSDVVKETQKIIAAVQLNKNQS